ncbi:hypothetical protein MVEN_01325000 [Mycena venus]|uniref:DUF6699 domain-containing protein n=1 Tax=Mycena venus TaxID=2733690 RepID=A0A8H6Y0M2_9AGAR|nr:hypothetical protein MVEN_01325000 [Mycena venus]
MPSSIPTTMRSNASSIPVGGSYDPPISRGPWAPCAARKTTQPPRTSSFGWEPLVVFEPGLIWERSPYACVSLPDVSAPPARPDVLPRREFRQRYEPAQPRIQPIALPAQIPGVTDIKLNRVLRFGARSAGARCIDVDFGLSEERLGLSSGVLAELATFPGLPSLTLLSPMLPWVITAHASGDGGVTVRDVLQAIHRELEIRITEEQPDTWMVQRGEDDEKKGEKWRKARVPTSGVSSTPQGLKRKRVDHKRLDLLEGRTVFAGLSESTMGPEVWTVMFV